MQTAFTQTVLVKILHTYHPSIAFSNKCHNVSKTAVVKSTILHFGCHHLFTKIDLTSHKSNYLLHGGLRDTGRGEERKQWMFSSVQIICNRLARSGGGGTFSCLTSPSNSNSQCKWWMKLSSRNARDKSLFTSCWWWLLQNMLPDLLFNWYKPYF